MTVPPCLPSPQHSSHALSRRELSAPFWAVTDICLVSVQDRGPRWAPCLSSPGRREPLLFCFLKLGSLTLPWDRRISFPTAAESLATYKRMVWGSGWAFVLSGWQPDTCTTVLMLFPYPQSCTQSHHCDLQNSMDPSCVWCPQLFWIVTLTHILSLKIHKIKASFFLPGFPIPCPWQNNLSVPSVLKGICRSLKFTSLGCLVTSALWWALEKLWFYRLTKLFFHW